MSLFTKDKPMAAGGQVTTTAFTYEQERRLADLSREKERVRLIADRLDRFVQSEERRVEDAKAKEKEALTAQRQGRFLYTIACTNKPDVAVDADYTKQFDDVILVMKDGLPFEQCEASTSTDVMTTITRKPNPKYKAPK